tara:strand:+ start:799 stop:1071 length:273 start_codon:yes stop_codon:yes gene_type:complete
MQNLNLTTVEEAVAYLKQTQKNLNPSKAKLGKKVIVRVSVDNERDFNLLVKAKKQIRNIKWVGIVQEQKVLARQNLSERKDLARHIEVLT